MDEEDKLPLKRMELSLTKFNEVAIPHHLDLLRQHKANIIKYSSSGGGVRLRAEQAAAGRAAAALRGLLAELAAARARTRSRDLPRFDALTQRARDSTLAAIMDYLESCPMPAAGRAEGARAAPGSVTSTESVGVVRDEEPLQLHVHEDADALQLQADEEALRSWRHLQEEVHALHDAWRATHDAALTQRDATAGVARTVTAAAGDVAAARTHLAAGERLRGGAVALGGAALGALAGGPVGLAVGFKAGAAVALAGSLLGYAGARLLGARNATPPEEPPCKED